MSNDLFNPEDSRTIEVDIQSEMKKSYLDYSMSVIVGRALPDVRDGLKPVHRRILYSAYEKGLTPDKSYRKSAETVGVVLADYHPHGDASVYDAMVRLVQDFSMRYPLIDGQGNFGSIDGDPAAAYRYTESRMSKISMHLLSDIDKETVDYAPNYNDAKKEPVVLPSRFPNLLVNGSTGIAVGMATNIPPHNLGEVIDAVNLLIENPEATLDEIMQFVQGPDFPTGGIIMGRSGIRAAYGTGRGRITLRGRTEIEEMPNGKSRIIVTEIPYMVNKSRLIESIADLVKEKRIDQISDLRDESDRDGMRIVIELKRDANPQVVLNQLYSYSQLQETVGVIMLAIADGVPRTMHLKEILQRYLDFQKQIIVRRTIFDLNKAKERAHILEGLKIALDFIDEVISILRASKSIPEGKAALMERFGLTDVQSQAIVAMRLGQLTGLERDKIEEELETLHARIAELEGILADEAKVFAIIKEELAAIRQKYADPRRTEIMAVSGEVDIEDLIPEGDCVITLTHFGYIKRQPTDVYRTQRRGGRGVQGMTRKEEDFVEELFVCSTHDYVLFFTSKGKMYRLKGYEIPECSRASRGNHIVNILPIEKDEKITSLIKVSELDEESFLVMVTRRGIIKRTRLYDYRNVRKGGLIAINLDEGDELAWVLHTDGAQQLIVATRTGMAIRFDENDARAMGRSARGVKAVTLGEDDEVVGMTAVTPDATLLTVSEKGLGRRTNFEEYRLQTRGGKGIRNYYTDGKNGVVAGVKTVHDDDDVIIITDDGIIIRIAASEIAMQSRYGGGVRAMRVGEDTRVVTLARAAKEETPDDEETEEGEGEALSTQDAAAPETEAAGEEE